MARTRQYQQQPVGIHKGTSPKGMFLFGTPFFAVGCWITCIGLEIVEVDPSKVHAPMWVLTVVGLVFASAGLLVWGMGWQQRSILKRLSRQAAQYPGEPAMADYPWDRDGYSPPRWTPVRKAWSATAFMLVFSSVFNWWAFGSGDGPLPVQIGIGLLDLFLLWVLWRAIKTTWHALKFGRTRLRFDRFPYAPGTDIELDIEIPASLRDGQSAELSLRQIKEYYTVTGHGKQRQKRLVQEVCYAEDQSLSQHDLAAWPGRIRSQWSIPSDAKSSQLYAEQPVFWELELTLARPGLDLKQHYLVPIYTI